MSESVNVRPRWHMAVIDELDLPGRGNNAREVGAMCHATGCTIRRATGRTIGRTIRRAAGRVVIDMI